MMEKKNETVEDHFNKLFRKKGHLNYDFDIQKMGVKDRKIAQALIKYGIKGKKCLDAGPGTGKWLRFMKQYGASYLAAIDISASSLKRCAQFCTKIQKADLENEDFNFESDSFDIVVSFEVIEHLRNPNRYLSEIYRVIKNGGLILMSLPNITSFISRMRMIFGLLPVAIATDVTHVRFYRRKEIVKLFKQFNMMPNFIPLSISLNPKEPKSKFSIPSFKAISCLDDSILFFVIPQK